MSACIKEELVATKQEMPEIQENQVHPNRIQLNIKTNKTENEASANLLLDTTIVKTENNEKLLGINIFSDYSSGFIKTEELFVKDGILDMIEEEDEEESDAVDVGVESHNKTNYYKNRKKSRRKLHFSVLKLKDLYPQVHIPNQLHSLDLDPFVLLTPFTNHDLCLGDYRSQKINNKIYKSVSSRAPTKMTNNRTNVKSEVHQIEEKTNENIEGFYTCFLCEKSFSSRLDLETHVIVHLKHSGENDGAIRFSGNIIKEEKLEIKEEFVAENSNERREDTEGEKDIVDKDVAKKNLKGETSKGYLCATRDAYSCTICNKKLCNKNSLNQHMMIVHNGVKPYSCNECQKKFGKKSTLNRHMMSVHRSVKPYNCNECQKKFVRKLNLKLHMKNIHSSVKPYSCNECKKQFGEKSTLKRHIKSVHSGMKPYSCNECQKQFGEKGILKRHMKTVHSGLKPYSCNECQKKFGENSTLKRHMKSVHSATYKT